MVSIGVLEFDKIIDVPFATFRRSTMAPSDAFGRKLGLPRGKLLRTSRTGSGAVRVAIRC